MRAGYATDEMRRVVLAALLGSLAVGCAGTTSATVHGSGHVVSESRTVSPFERIELKGAAAVHVSVGGPRAVTVRADDNIVRLLRTRVVGDTLVISHTESYSTADGVTVDVTVPRFVGSTLSGAGSIVADGVTGPSFELSLLGAGMVDLGGSVGRLVARLTGVGDARLEHLHAKDVSVELTGTGSAHVYATRSLEALVSGVGSVTFSGDPATVHEDVTGLGSVIKA